MPLSADQHDSLVRFTQLLVNQQQARVIVPPQAPASGYWFGGGNMVSAHDGALYLVGRYRNAGDSRTGLAAGERGLELTIFRSADFGQMWTPVLRFSKRDLDLPGRPVLSIEGSALRWTTHGVQLFVSTERDGVGYPPEFAEHLKPGTGVWSIDVLTAPTLEALKTAPIQTLLASADPRYVHIKDPFLYQPAEPAEPVLLFCSHPFCWTSSNTGYAPIDNSSIGAVRINEPVFEFFPRGVTWDVAMTRGTCVLDVPQRGMFQDLSVSLMFYDGGECVRNLEQHSQGVNRPRGYSCEELGGAACFVRQSSRQPGQGVFDHIRLERLSRYAPLFVSPFGTGCSRYVDVLSRPEGLYVTWQQGQADGSQPLVLNFVPQEKIAECLQS